MATDATTTDADEEAIDAAGKPKRRRLIIGELAAMADIADLLESLEGDEQFRVKQWFLSKCKAETANA